MSLDPGDSGSSDSVALNALVWLGMAVVVTGVVMLVGGLSDTITFSIKVLGQELSATSTGVLVIVAGLVLIFLPMKMRPDWTPKRALGL